MLCCLSAGVPSRHCCPLGDQQVAMGGWLWVGWGRMDWRWAHVRSLGGGVMLLEEDKEEPEDFESWAARDTGDTGSVWAGTSQL